MYNHVYVTLKKKKIKVKKIKFNVNFLLWGLPSPGK